MCLNLECFTIYRTVWGSVLHKAFPFTVASNSVVTPSSMRRFTADRAKRYVDKVHVQHRRGEAPPGHVDSAKVDWSGVGAR